MTSDLLAYSQTFVRGDTNTELVLGIFLFLLTGVLVPFVILLVGRFIRPRLPNPEKGLPYECGEPVIGDSWVQFDLRFYVVALIFIIFDVEIALFWPWALVFGQGTPAIKTIALYDMLFFFGVIVVGFLYLWRYGYLDWVRATPAGKDETVLETGAGA
jgi:NADH-quinone oxidoreductase subunit A